MDGSSHYPGTAGFNAPSDTGVQSGTSFPPAVVMSIVLMILALTGFLIQLLREYNCFMRSEENAADSNRNFFVVQFNGTNSIPSINHMVSHNATNSNPNPSVMASSDANNSDISTGDMRPLTATSSGSNLEPLDATNSGRSTSQMAPLTATRPGLKSKLVNATNSDQSTNFGG